MVRAREPEHKVSRRFGIDVYGTGGAALQRRLEVPPGGMPKRRVRRTEYGRQLHEKQKAKAIYGVQEGQFRRYFAEASRRAGPPGETLLRLLEQRLDNVVYRLGFARSRPMARQLVGHGHVLVNGRRVDIPSYLVQAGDAITLTPIVGRMPTVVEELASGRAVPDWLEVSGATGHVRGLPDRRAADAPIDESLIVGFYSR
ncbi:MAG: 30S ribosomal protein S4 [Actinomycetota bacterium]|nr:30S ribosomal protein S4 [Actinomycetota bacterium]